ncbi:MAG TPA: alpha/beta hydrolase [Anaerolineales bacterium]|nr:alpha/beta hydrolase [Anaerolineales bacterium]
MSTVPTLPGITPKMIDTNRLKTHVLFSGAENGTPVLFLHGNASSATYWEEIMLKLPSGFRGIAPDLRGYGDTENKLIDATRGAGDWVDDILALMDALNVDKAHVIGHSMGGALVFNLVAAAPSRVLSGTVVNPGSPFGFGGSKGLDGNPNYDDFAGSGGGVVNPEFPKLMAAGDRSTDNPQASPRVVMNSFYWKPPFKPAREEDLLTSLMTEKVGADKYPGDFVASTNWPNVAPGNFGPINALSPKYVGDSVTKFIDANPKPHILWVRGDSDQIVSDNSLFDFGTLGKLGFVPGWPGEEVYPPQPMVGQTRSVLEQYKAKGGSYEEVVIADTGHSPYIEKPEEFMAVFTKVLK